MVTKVAIIIPCFKARGKIGSFIKQLLIIKAILNSTCDINIYLVDDCCPDESFQEVELKDGIKLIRNKNNLGVGGATLRGFEKAIVENNQYFIKMDADGQHPAEYLLELVPYLISLPIDRLIMVKGSRFSLEVKDLESPFIRRLGSFFLEPLAKISLSYRGITDIANGFISFNQITIEYLKSRRFLNKIEPRYLFESSLIKACSNLGVDIHEFNMHSIYGKNWSSSMKSYKIILPLLIYWIRSIFSRILSKYIYRFNFGSFLLTLSIINFLISLLLFIVKILPMIQQGIFVTPGNATGFTSAFILFVVLFCFFVIYDFGTRIKVHKVFFRISSKEFIPRIK